jgi:hypothetical protein
LRPAPLRLWQVLLVATLGACGSAFSSAGPEGGTGEGGGPSDAGGPADSASKPDTSVDAERAKEAAPDAVTAEGGKSTEAGRVDAGKGKPTYCGAMLECTGTGGQQGTVCCIAGATASPTYGCATAGCACSDTQLDCAYESDCPGQHCCIGKQIDADAGCPTGHYVAGCQATCGSGFKQLCDPKSLTPGCGGLLKACAQGGTFTVPVGLPPDSGFGVCK